MLLLKIPSLTLYEFSYFLCSYLPLLTQSKQKSMDPFAGPTCDSFCLAVIFELFRSFCIESLTIVST